LNIGITFANLKDFGNELELKLQLNVCVRIGAIREADNLRYLALRLSTPVDFEQILLISKEW